MKRYFKIALLCLCLLIPVNVHAWGVALMGIPGGAAGFVTTWSIEEGDKTITLPLRAGFTYNMTVNWGDGSSSEVTAFDDADNPHTYASAGTKTVTITGTCQAWYFNNGGDKLKFRTVKNWGDVGFTGLGLVSAFYGCSNATSFGTSMPYYAVTSLHFTWYNCSTAESFPNVSTLTLVNTLAGTWSGCSSALSFPDVSALTLVNTLQGTWLGCSSAESFPDVSALTSVNTLIQTWYNCSSAESFPDVSALTLVTTLYYTWYGCSTATSFPDVSALTLVTTLSNAWYGCSTAESFPDVSALTLVTTLANTWYGCSSCTTVPTLPAASTALTTTTSAFQSIGAGMSGTVADLWNAVDYPNITAFGNTFTGATGLDNYGDIPDGWKGL